MTFLRIDSSGNDRQILVARWKTIGHEVDTRLRQKYLCTKDRKPNLSAPVTGHRRYHDPVCTQNTKTLDRVTLTTAHIDEKASIYANQSDDYMINGPELIENKGTGARRTDIQN